MVTFVVLTSLDGVAVGKNVGWEEYKNRALGMLILKIHKS